MDALKLNARNVGECSMLSFVGSTTSMKYHVERCRLARLIAVAATRPILCLIKNGARRAEVVTSVALKKFF